MNIQFTGDWLPKSSLSLSVKDDDCLRVGNLECVLVDGNVASNKAYTSVLPFESVANVMCGNFVALSLANNHVYDAGDEAFNFMKRRLAEDCPGIQFFGTVDKPFAVLGGMDSKVAVIGSLEKCRSRGKLIFKEEDVKKLIDDIRSTFDVVYVYPHWGKEGEYTRWPSPRQRNLARRWIDAGADGVFGSHSHVFQGKEEYKGKPIYYSLGNYFFPHPESKLYDGTHDGLSVEVDKAKVIELYHHFEDDGRFIENSMGPDTMVEISQSLRSWDIWKWAKAVGPFNLKKNTASWQIRMKKNFWTTLPKFVVWQFLPQTLLFRMASLWH